MKTSLLTTLLFSSLTTLTSALPTAAICSNLTSPFLLVTTTKPNCGGNSSVLTDVSAISVYDPNHSTTLYLRTILPGYNSLPNFTLADGALQTSASGPFASRTQLYNSTAVTANQPLGFVAAANTTGALSLASGYLLANNGSTEGWTLCKDPLGEVVITWQGTDPSCKPTYVQATNTPPY